MPDETLRLVTLPLSPYSERAKWALDHHGLRYQTIVHAPFLGERRLRKLVGKGKPRVTVPILLTGSETLHESWDIARHADRVGHGTPLIKPEREAEIRRWNDLADKAMEAGRAAVVAATLASPGALDEGLPPAMPRWLRPAMRPMTRYGLRWFARKYQIDLADIAPQVATFRAALLELRRALAGRPYLLGELSYADILMATVIQGILPVDDRYLPVGPATRKVWTNDALAAEFADLVAWRDQLYQRDRAKP